MVVTKYIGRPSPWKGKTLYDIACNLKNRGEGRVVVRWSLSKRYAEKSYYRLTRVEPDPTDLECMRGTAWGIRVFRGQVSERPIKIDTGHRADWRLIPKEEEEEFCRLTDKDVYVPKTELSALPREMTLPPLLESLYRQHLADKGDNQEGPITVNLRLQPKKLKELKTLG